MSVCAAAAVVMLQRSPGSPVGCGTRGIRHSRYPAVEVDVHVAEGLHQCLRTPYPNAFIYLHFDPILPEHVFFSAGAELINAAQQQGKTGS